MRSVVARVLCVLGLAAVGGVPAMALAATPAPQWVESSEAQPTVLANGYFDDGISVATHSFSVGVINAGLTEQHMALYLGSATAFDFLGNATALAWNNTAQRFEGAGMFMTVVSGVSSIQLSQIAAPTVAGADPAWSIPFIDFGSLRRNAPPATVSVTFALTITDPAAFSDWTSIGGQVNPNFQGLSVVTAPVPEPEQWALMLAGIAVLGVWAKRRRVQ